MFELGQAAKLELREFAEASFPQSRCPGWVAFCYFVAFLLVPVPGVYRLLRSMARFWAAYVRCGSHFRIATLLVVGRAVKDLESEVDDDEYRDFEDRAARLIVETNTVFSTFQVVSALFVGATYMVSIGRPGPWKASDASVNAFGKDAADVMLAMAHTGNVLAQTFAIVAVALSVLYRTTLSFLLLSTHDKLHFIVYFNPIFMVVYSTQLVMFNFIVVAPFAGPVSYPTIGYVNLVVPVVLLATICLYLRFMLYVLKNLHVEARMAFGLTGDGLQSV